ncbi:hypothetical protein K443DRAFT_679310 [Laccaria amethystina LaAM-08-1]|uniref:Uncharacterized protein n=1 Tax=Laccaria amethystina LaAM-08-1 TaxID=1095629 RepID=A0A0C9X5A7_9AGAR|nr:hypothetical protein K443DRAFT_679310 [Laccaria amethystina LaAM-08-1]
MDGSDSSLAALTPIFFLFAFLMAALIFWCLISSCLGTSVLQSMKNLWDYAVLSSRNHHRNPMSYRRRAFGDEEIWEMEHRGRAG